MIWWAIAAEETLEASLEALVIKTEVLKSLRTLVENS